MAERSAGEQEYIVEQTRAHLVGWADWCVRGGELHDVLAEDAIPTGWVEPYRSTAVEKGWLTKSEPRRLTAKGFKAAAAFLRR